MVKTLQQIGNSWGVIIDRPVLDLLGITAETPLKVELARNGSRALVSTPLEGDEAAAHADPARTPPLDSSAPWPASP